MISAIEGSVSSASPTVAVGNEVGIKSQNHPGSDLKSKADEKLIHHHTRLMEGEVFIDQYDETGKLIKVTPPGYLPFGEIV